jgi:hypothetical protein
VSDKEEDEGEESDKTASLPRSVATIDSIRENADFRDNDDFMEVAF